MEFGFVVFAAIAWMVLNTVREAMKQLPGGKRPDGPGGPLSRPGAPGAGRNRFGLPGSFADASPGLRELLDAIENAKARAEGAPVRQRVSQVPQLPAEVRPQRPAPGRPRPPAPEVGLEGAPSEVFEDAGPVRRRRERVDLDEESAEVARRRREAVARREAGRTAADHPAFDARIRQEPADVTAVAVPPPRSYPDLRQALIWREILSPPKSLRDD